MRHLMVSVLSLLLMACQQQLEIKEKEKVAVEKRSKAALDNVQLGLAYLKQGDTPRAKRKLLTALRLAPDSSEAYASMGYFLEKTGEQQDAKDYYQKALALSPQSGAQKNNYGAFLCRIGEYSQAMTLLIEAGEDVQYPNSAMAYENAGLCALAMHDEKKGSEYFERALKQDPDRELALYELVRLKLTHHESKQALIYLQDHASVTLNQPAFLTLAIKAAEAEGNSKIAAEYQQRLDFLHRGGVNEHS